MKTKDNLSKDGKTYLMKAIERKSLREAKTVLKLISASDVKAVDKNGSNALHYLTSLKDSDHFFQIEDSRFYDYFTTVYKPNSKWHKVMEKLIDAGIDINAKDDYGRAPLNLAIERGDFLMAKKLLTYENIDPNIQDKEGNTPLIHLFKGSSSDYSHQERTQLVKDLISKGASSSIKNNDGLSPLNILVTRTGTYSSPSEKFEEMQLAKLLANKENINFPCKNGLSPLFAALKNGNFKLAEDFIDQGASLYSENGNTAFHFIGSSYNFISSKNEQEFLESKERIFQKLLQNCDNVTKHINQINLDGYRPLDLAAQSELNFDLVKLLVKSGADPTKINSHNKTSLNYALECRAPQTFSFLLETSPSLKNSISQSELFNLAKKTYFWDIKMGREVSSKFFYELLKAGVEKPERAIKSQPKENLINLIKRAIKDQNSEILLKITENFEKKIPQTADEFWSQSEGLQTPQERQKFIEILSKVDFTKPVLEAGFAQRNLHLLEKPKILHTTNKKAAPIDVDGQTPLMENLRNNPERFIDYIKQNSDIDFTKTDATGSNILHHLAKLVAVHGVNSLSFYDPLQVVFERISESGADIKKLLNQRNNEDLTPVDAAAYSIFNDNFIKISEISGFDLLQKNSSGKDVLHHALKNKCPRIIEYLLKSAPDLIQSISEENLSEFAQTISLENTQTDYLEGSLLTFCFLLEHGAEKAEKAVRSLNEVAVCKLIVRAIHNPNPDLLSKLVVFLGKEKISNELTLDGYVDICSRLSSVNNPELQQQMLKILKNGGFETIETDFGAEPSKPLYSDNDRFSKFGETPIQMEISNDEQENVKKMGEDQGFE